MLISPCANANDSTSVQPLSGQHQTETDLSDNKNATGEHKKFNPGEYIFEHIGDAHEWHIITLGNTHISIPLPVILFSKQKGVVAFWSTRFNHGHSDYKGFRLETEGDNKGKVVESLSDGTEALPFDISITKNVAALFCSIIIILLIFISIGNAYKRNPIAPPRGLQSLIEPVILFVRDDVAKP